MPLGSAPTSTIDIDFTRAQGHNSSGRIIFKPVRQRIGTTMLSTDPIVVEINGGIGSVDLVRLNLGTYRVTEEIDGTAPFQFSFALPMSSPSTIQYENIAPVSSVPGSYMSVRTINGEAPDPVTGNIELDLSDGVEVPDATQSVKGLIRLTGDLSGTADNPELSTTLIEEITEKYVKPSIGIPASDLTAAVQALLGAAATAVQPGALDSLVSAIGNRALPDRIVRVADKSKQDNGNVYSMQNTGGAWQLFVDGPAEYTIQASAGDDIELSYDILIDVADQASTDLVVVTGATPSPARYLSSMSSTPSFGGSTGNYPSGAKFEGRSGTFGFSAEPSDIDNGFIRVRWAVKTMTDDGKMYASNSYPLLLSIRNTRLSGF